MDGNRVESLQSISHRRTTHHLHASEAKPCVIGQGQEISKNQHRGSLVAPAHALLPCNHSGDVALYWELGDQTMPCVPPLCNGAPSSPGLRCIRFRSAGSRYHLGNGCGNPLSVASDISEPTKVAYLTCCTVATYGRLDYAFNSAGIRSCNPHSSPKEVPSHDIDVNRTGARACKFCPCRPSTEEG